MRLVAHLAARRGDRIGARRQRPGQRAQMLGGERNRKVFKQVDQLTAGDPVARVAGRRAAP